jgi:hypothetical protein
MKYIKRVINVTDSDVNTSHFSFIKKRLNAVNTNIGRVIFKKML